MWGLVSVVLGDQGAQEDGQEGAFGPGLEKRTGNVVTSSLCPTEDILWLEVTQEMQVTAKSLVVHLRPKGYRKTWLLLQQHSQRRGICPQPSCSLPELRAFGNKPFLSGTILVPLGPLDPFTSPKSPLFVKMCPSPSGPHRGRGGGRVEKTQLHFEACTVGWNVTVMLV